MKSVIADFKELQVNLFYAITNGMQERGPLGPDGDLHIIPEITREELQWRVMRHPTAAGCAVEGQLVHEFRMHRGYSQLNDVRFGVITSYLRGQAERFLKEVDEKFQKKFSVEPETV